ncbi:TPR repeat protein (plasmid) [Azospirillum sp. B510]|nr:TPR repeat protein [Azospirillum sp. B510]
MRVATTEDQVRQIVADFNAGRFEQAISLCEAGLRRNRNDPILNHLFAAVLFAKGDAARAGAHIRTSLAAKADNAPGHLLAGRIARSCGDFERALFHLGRAAAMSPSLEILLEQARTVDAVGDRNRSIDAWRAVTRANPGLPEAAARLGRLLFEDGLLRDAAAVLEAVPAAGRTASLWFDLGLVKQDLRDLAGAADAYREALELQPGNAEAAVNLGIVLQDMRDIDGAVAAYQVAYGVQPETFGVIAMSLTSAPRGQLWLDRQALKRMLKP